MDMEDYYDYECEEASEERDGWMDWSDEAFSDDEAPDHGVRNESRWDDE